ncbi:MAG: amidohydrolase family protein, partial [Victivallales bacterium]|nr:amidohydrolase family protein [Victivallales bacterium]
LARLGADRILFGSDVPGRDFAVQLGRIHGVAMPDEDRDKILRGNAVTLLGLA